MPPRASRMDRGPGPKRKTRIRAKSPKTGGHRFPRLVDEGLREFVRGLACSACGAKAPSHPHHVKTRGSGGADWNNLAPLCGWCHDAVHIVGRRTFATKFGVDLPGIALRATAAYVLLGGSPASPGSAHPGAPTP